MNDSTPAVADADPARSRRMIASVLIDGLSATGTLLAEQLVHAGIGTVVLRDRATAGAAEIAAGGSAMHSGLDRAAALARRLRPCAPDQLVLAPREGVESVAVDVEVAVVAPGSDTGGITLSELARCWQQGLSRATAVLPVTVESRRAEIGPLLLRRGGVCPECMVLHGSSHHRGLFGGVPDPSGALAATVAGWAAVQILGLIDGVHQSPGSIRCSAFDAVTGNLVQSPVAPHPECSCATLLSEDMADARIGPRRFRRRPPQREEPSSPASSPPSSSLSPAAPP